MNFYFYKILSSLLFQPLQGWAAARTPAIQFLKLDLAVDRADALTLRHPLGGIEQMLDSQAFGFAFLFLLFSKNALCSVRVSGWSMRFLLELYGWMVFELFKRSPSYLMARLGGVPSRDWISQRWYSWACYPGGALHWALTLEQSSGTRQLRNWCKDAIRFHTYIANIDVGFLVKRKPRSKSN